MFYLAHLGGLLYHTAGTRLDTVADLLRFDTERLFSRLYWLVRIYPHFASVPCIYQLASEGGGEEGSWRLGIILRSSVASYRLGLAFPGICSPFLGRCGKAEKEWATMMRSWKHPEIPLFVLYVAHRNQALL